MSLSYSDGDIEPGSSADSLLRRMGRRPHLGATAFSHRSHEGPHATDPTGLEAQLIGAGVTSPFNIWRLEEVLRQQACLAVDKRQHEIAAFEKALHGALAELDRVRVAEEARLADRVHEATRRFQQQIEALQQQYLADVEKLKRQTVTELNKQRAHSEAVIAARMRVLQAELRYDRPTGLSPLDEVPPPPPVTMPRVAVRTRDSSPGPSAVKPQAHNIRLRSAPSARAAAGAWDRPVATVPSVGGSSPVAAATPNRGKLESGEALW